MSSTGACSLSCHSVPHSFSSLLDGQAEALMEGGVRRGRDIIRAMCLGARAVLVGWTYAYGLAADGQTAVARALEILRDDVERTLRLLGCPSALLLTPSYVNVPAHWRWKAAA